MRTRRPSLLAPAETLDYPRNRSGRRSGSPPAVLPWNDAEHQALLRVVPGQVFRIQVCQDGGVSVVGDLICVDIPAGEIAHSAVKSRAKGESGDQARNLCVALARQSRGLLEQALRTGEVQTLEVQIGHNGQMIRHQIRAAAYGPEGLLALVGDADGLGRMESNAAGLPQGTPRLSEVLRSGGSLPGEDEKVIKNVFARLNGLLEETIAAIQSIVQTNDPATAHHQARVWKLACAIGREMGMGKTQVDVIGLAALLHDFGKVFIPADILNKPGKLTEAEFSAVKKHAETVFQILRTIDLFCPIADIVHQHHERLDGSGYPLGLKGEAILIEARVIAVADVVEAMLSDRPHRPALSVDSAMAEIASGRGRLYDANAVDACIRLFRVNKFEFD